MRKRLAPKIVIHSAAAWGGINRLETGRERLGLAGFLEGIGLGSLEKRLNRPAQLCPELDLAGDRSLGNWSDKPRVEHKFFRNLHGLAHVVRVAKRYLYVKSHRIASLLRQVGTVGLDACPEDVLNRILWQAVKGSTVPYPGWAMSAEPAEDR
jgi:hypothetical protein